MTSSELTLLENIIGHESQKKHLKLLFENECVPHAMMFCGPSGIGKRTLAFSFASALLSVSSAGGSLENTKKLIRSGSHPDLHIVHREDGKKDLAVEQIRNLSSTLQLKPYFGGSATAIIDNAHEMSLAASNALLMTLEEPPQNTYLILVTDSPQRLPETIVSRCRLLYFGELSREDTRHVIDSCLADLDLETTLLDLLTDFAGGSITPIGLKPFVDPETLAITRSKALSNHLNNLISISKELDEQISPLFSTRKITERTAYAASVAASLCANKDMRPLVWYRLQVVIRNKLRESTSTNAFGAAQALIASIDAEKLTRERNLNPQLQMSSLLVKIAECNWN